MKVRIYEDQPADPEVIEQGGYPTVRTAYDIELSEVAVQRIMQDWLRIFMDCPGKLIEFGIHRGLHVKKVNSNEQIP